MLNKTTRNSAILHLDIKEQKRKTAVNSMNFPFDLSIYELDVPESITEQVISYIIVLIFSSYLNVLENKVGFLHITAATLMAHKVWPFLGFG